MVAWIMALAEDPNGWEYIAIGLVGLAWIMLLCMLRKGNKGEKR